ncbi:MAG: polyphenol oxidase family protein [Candidatus Omnitrophica bacterium]|nr:polyphenol oxidase family protein [Candidatus Omnitrophota bacterium]
MKLSPNNFFPDQTVAFTTDKTTDFSLGDHGFNSEQQKCFSMLTGLSGESPLTHLRQIHHDGIKILKEGSFTQSLVVEGDGLITSLRHRPLMVRTADCLPVFIYHPKKRVIGLLHAGWKGVRAGILLKALHLFECEFQADAAESHIYIGPSIRKCCYEVGDEFKNYFPQYILQSGRSLFLDLAGAAADQLSQTGVSQNHIQISPCCSCCHPRCHSYRRDRESSGRMLSVFMLK